MPKDPTEPDTGYNFLIGSDGAIHEGRGFNIVVPQIDFSIETGMSNFLGIAFIGDFSEDSPTSTAIDSCKALLKKAVDEKHIPQNSRVYIQKDVRKNSRTQWWNNIIDRPSCIIM